MVYNNQYVSTSRAWSLDETNEKHPVSSHFRLGEFACKSGSRLLLVHPVLVHLLEQIRTHFGLPIEINSAFRTHEHNRKIKGEPMSRHLYGMAADIVIAGVKSDDVATYAELIGAGGVGRYNTFTHVDVWKEGRRWDYRK